MRPWRKVGCGPCTAVLLVATCLAAPALGQRTPLLELDLHSGRQRTFDRAGPRTTADASLDALLDEGEEAGFSSGDLEGIARALRRYIDNSRPRARAKMLLFLYPSRISRSKLQELREITVEIEIVVDPCGRSVCDASVATQLELLGRALRQAVIRSRRVVIRFTAVTFRVRRDLRGAQLQVLRFRTEDVVRAGKERGGVRLLKKLQQAEVGYEAAMASQIARRARFTRVKLQGSPVVSRSRGAVTVRLRIGADRVRLKRQVVAAMKAASAVLGKNSHTPASVQLEVEAQVSMRGQRRRSFSCPGHPIASLRAGRLTEKELWGSYIVERRKGGRHLSFSDDDARGTAPSAAGRLDAARATEILSGRMALLSPCLRAALARDRRIEQVTMHFSVSRSGRAMGLSVKGKRGGQSLRRCLERGLSRVRFPSHAGPPLRVDYQMYLR